jgi:hypothetical protein
VLVQYDHAKIDVGAIITNLIKYNHLPQLRTLASAQDTSGYTPFHLLINSLCMQLQSVDLMDLTLQSKLRDILKKLAELFVLRLNFDITTPVGLVKHVKD